MKKKYYIVSIEKLVELLEKKKEEKTKRKARKTVEDKEESVGEELSATKTREALYRKLIEKYASVIGAGEEKTIPELKALVAPKDEKIIEVKEKLVSENNEEFLFKALEFVQTLKPIHANLSVSYWLSPSEMLELGAADPLDKAIFLCALLEAKGLKALVRVIELDGGLKHAIVIVSLNEKKFVADACGRNCLIQAVDLEKALAEYSCDGKKIARSLYEFNDEDYEEFAEE